MKLPWRMWYGPDDLEVDWPGRWDVQVCAMADAAALCDDAVAARVAAPIGTPPLEQLARGRKNCCILIDDLTRPTSAHRVVPYLLEQLRTAGLAARNVFFIVANGTHRALTRADLLKKLGAEVCDTHVVMRHDCHRDLVKIGAVHGVGDIMVNRFFHEADLKLAVTGVMPHSMCGFSGGAKMVMPAVCGFETIAATHGHAVEGPPAAVGVAEGNRMRETMNECARIVGLDFTVNCVFNSRGGLCGLYCGDVQAGYDAAVQFARRLYATDVPYGNDIAVFNAFPKDTEFIQAMAALNIWADRDNPGRDVVRAGGSIVVICACSEGLGSHGLIEYGRPQFRRRDRHGSFRRILSGRNLLFLAPNVSEEIVHVYYPPEARLFKDWPSLRTAVEDLHPGPARVAVFPASALQIDRAFRGERLARG